MEQGGTAPQAAPDLIKDTTTQTFVKDVIEESKRQPVLIDFWAEWCGPCRQLTPILEKAVRNARGKVKLVKMDIDKHPSIPGQLRIQSLPTVYAFRDGRPLDGFMGAQPESAVRAFVDRLLGEDAEDDIVAVLAEADAVLEAGDLQGAAEIYAAILRDDNELRTRRVSTLAMCSRVSARKPGMSSGARSLPMTASKVASFVSGSRDPVTAAETDVATFARSTQPR